MDDPAAAVRVQSASSRTSQVRAVEMPPPGTDRVLLGELDQSGDYRILRSHGTTDHLLLHTVAGAGLVHGEDGSVHRIGPGEAVLLRPGTLQDYGTDPAVGRWQLLFAHVHPPAPWLALLDWPEAAPGLGRIHLGAAFFGTLKRQLPLLAAATVSTAIAAIATLVLGQVLCLDRDL